MKDVLPDGIVAAGVKRMAARQPAQPHPDPLPSAVTLDGFAHVLRTGRKEAAGRGKKGGNQELVHAEGAGDDPLQRRKRRSTSRCEFRHRSIEGFASRIDDDGPLWAQPIEVKADGLADAPLDTVAHDRFTDGARDSETDMRPIRLRLADTKSGEEGSGEPGTLVINSSEVFGSQQTDTFRKTRDGVLPLGADGQFLAATGAAAGENGAAVLGLHTGAKPVRFSAMAIIRLKSTFRHFSSSI